VPRLVLTRNGQEISSINFGEGIPNHSSPLIVYEHMVYGFSLLNKEPEYQYALWTGDICLETDEQGEPLDQALSIGRSFGANIIWQDGRYFDGARGRVQIRLSAAKTSEDHDIVTWNDRLLWPVYVVSTKLTEEAFETMCEELRRLAGGLLFDLISKATLGLATGQSEKKPVWHYSSQLELRLLERLWEKFSRALYEVFREPWTKLAPESRIALCYGSEKFDLRAVTALAICGTDPMKKETIKPFRANRTILTENLQITEHEVIIGFLYFLLERLQDCRMNVKKHVAAIEEDRPYRQLPSGAGASLYDTVDVPKLRKLERAKGRADILEGQIRAALTTDCLRGVRPRFAYPDTPVFRNIESYYRLSAIMHEYLNSALIVLDEGDEERLKSTSRLYEQWVFLQLAAAFKRVGLTCVSRDGMLNRVRRYRYTLDIDRGASLTFAAKDGWLIVVRFEPWILPKAVAEQRRDTVYRSSQQIAWSPDILIEFSAKELDGKRSGLCVVYAVVVDAKYTTHVGRNHRKTIGKYFDIRSTLTNRQIVRQVWVAAPCHEVDHEIRMWDTELAWSDDGPTCQKDEQVGGILTMAPDASASIVEGGWLAEPVDVAVRFVIGLLNYVGVPYSMPAKGRDA